VIKNNGGDNEDAGNDTRHSNPSRTFYISILVILSFFYCSYLWVESIPGNLLGLFVVEGLGWEATSVSLVMSTNWGFHCLGRLVGVPVSMVLKPAIMITINIIAIFVAFCLLYVGTLFYELLVWVAIALAAFGMASTFAVGVLLSDQYIRFRGVAASVVIISASVGGLTGPPAAGYLFETYGHMTFVYILLASSVLLALCFILLMLLLRISGRFKQTKPKDKSNIVRYRRENNSKKIQLITTT
jgi:fucose permease